MRRRSARANPWARVQLAVAVLFAVIVFGVIGYMVLEGWSFIDALYMTILSLTAVGFTEVQPLDTSGKVFTIILILAGVTIVVVTLSLAAVAISEGGLGRHRRRRVQRQIDRLKNHFIVCGYGRVGRTVSRELEAAREKFVVVERSEDIKDDLNADGVLYLMGDPTHEQMLKGAGIDRARALISAVDSDADNVFITLLARSLSADLFIVARASEATSAERLYRAGGDRVISPHVTSGRHMAMLAMKPRVVDYLEVETRDTPSMRLEEVQVDPDGTLVGKRVGELPGGSVPLVVRRSNGQVLPNPGPQVVLEAGDLLVLLGETKSLQSVDGRL